MKHIEKLEKYCREKLIDFETDENNILIIKQDGEEGEFFLVPDDVILFDEGLNFLPICEYLVDGFVYYFGGRWYIQDADEKSVQLKELIYIDKAVQKLPTNSFLGIHSGYELMNGMALYKNWVKKAKFLGIDNLGICEKHTLSGVLVFQNECKSKGIKSIIGMTLSIQGDNTSFDIKLYVKNFQGWLNLLHFNSLINVDKQNSVSVDQLVKNIEGLYIVADPKSMEFAECKKIENHIDYYQLDPVNFLNEDKDSWYIDNLEKFILSRMSPISITDAYYLEQEDFRTREVLWTIAKAFDEKSDNQFFKNKDQYASELIQMFDKGEKAWVSLYKLSISNEKTLVDNCNFFYDTDTRHLPKYEMTKEESDKFSNNEEFFLHLISKGFKEKGFKDTQKYIDRLKSEIKVLKQGDVIDYFLALYDIIQFAKSEDMLTGIARGSAGGSLVAYLLGIIQIDPLEFDLLFERFLNSGRMGEYQDRPSFKLSLEDGSCIDLAEGSLVRIKRNGKEKVCLIHEVEQGDDLIKY